LSVKKITDKGYRVIFDRDEATVKDSRGIVKLVADHVDELYYIRGTTYSRSSNVRETAYNSVNVQSLETWHRRLGHLNERYLLEAVRDQSIGGIKLKTPKESLNCDICLRGKMTRAPFIKKNKQEIQILKIVHSDVCSPMRVESHGRAKYFVTFIDDRSKWCEVHFLRAKSEVIDAFKEYKALVENLRDKKIKYL